MGVTWRAGRTVDDIAVSSRGGGTHQFIIGSEDVSRRLDLFLSQMIPEVSRSLVADFIRTGQVLVNGSTRKAGYRLKQGEKIVVNIPPPVPTSLIPTKVDFRLIYEDDAMVILSKPPGVVVHPAHGHQQGTLVHGLLHYLQKLPVIGGEQRPGIVHRLDKDTSGLMVVAKTDQSHRRLVRLFKERKISKTYHAVVAGRLPAAQGCIDLQIGRHPVHRKKMSVSGRGRDAVTRWRLLQEFGAPFSYVELRPETGRTHQLRVHMAAMGHPIIGDNIYGKKYRRYGGMVFGRQFLHAYALSFPHPESGRPMHFTAPLWEDLQEIIDDLQALG
jgi:23S rRNA pseudouridine1911/1915/1917 synthase